MYYLSYMSYMTEAALDRALEAAAAACAAADWAR